MQRMGRGCTARGRVRTRNCQHARQMRGPAPRPQQHGGRAWCAMPRLVGRRASAGSRGSVKERGAPVVPPQTHHRLEVVPLLVREFGPHGFCSAVVFLALCCGQGAARMSGRQARAIHNTAHCSRHGRQLRPPATQTTRLQSQQGPQGRRNA